MGTAAYFLHISDDGGFGEILLMIAVMVAFQAELIWRRARVLSAATPGRDGMDDDRSLARRPGHETNPADRARELVR